MDAPLGRAVGNALEIAECLQLLRGEGPEDLTSLVVDTRDAHGHAGDRRGPRSGARQSRVRAALSSGAGVVAPALDDCAPRGRCVDRRGPGPIAAGQHTGGRDRPHPAYICNSTPTVSGRRLLMLGAGRERVEDPVDHAAGIVLEARPGTAIAAEIRCCACTTTTSGVLTMHAPSSWRRFASMTPHHSTSRWPSAGSVEERIDDACVTACSRPRLAAHSNRSRQPPR